MMDQTTCHTCTYYRQHYALDQRKIYRVYCGHCTYPKVRRKLPDSKSCEHYVQTSPNEEVFVTKEYLSKALLAHILQMELLPEIHDMGE